MSEQLLAMSGNFECDFKSYQHENNPGIEATALTIVECGTVHCTALLC